MADVLFITPNIDGGIREEPVGTLLLATILQNSGISVDIMQFMQFGELSDFDTFIATALKKVEEKAPKIISFYSRCDTYHISLTIAQKLKESWKNVWIVFGGPQADISAVGTIREIPWVDFVCCGEGETTVVPFFSSLLKNTPDLSVPGLVYRDKVGVHQNPRPKLIEDLDSLPEVDYSCMQYRWEDVENSGAFPVDVGRGCPFGCIYCSTKTFWGRRYRLKSPRRIVQEICHAREQFGISTFVFEHDMFTMRRDQVLQTCELLKTLEFPVAWSCSARLDCIDKEMIDAMVSSGFKSIFIGIETGSPRMQKLINKNLKLDGVLEMLEYISSRGIKVTTSFIYGFPEETQEDVEQTMQLIKSISELPGITIQTHLCTFLPGTELSVRYQSDMTPAGSYSDIVGMNALEECAELIEAHPALFSHFLEYKTPIRDKLQYFSVFFSMWNYTKPVYNYISQKYPEKSLLDMYYDFVQDNLTVLEQTKQLGIDECMSRIMQEDRFIQRFSGDENFDLISDIYRLKCVETSDKLNAGESVTDVYCFSPVELEKCRHLQECSRGVYFVTVMKTKSNGIKLLVRGKAKK